MFQFLLSTYQISMEGKFVDYEEGRTSERLSGLYMMVGARKGSRRALLIKSTKMNTKILQLASSLRTNVQLQE